MEIMKTASIAISVGFVLWGIACSSQGGSDDAGHDTNELNQKDDDPFLDQTFEAGPTVEETKDTEEGIQEVNEQTGTARPLPDVPPKAGVVYVTHFQSSELRWYRIDGEFPLLEGTLDMGKASHGAALDPVNDWLFVAHDTNQEVKIYQLDRPETPEDNVSVPVLLASISFDAPPFFVRTNPYKKRLYVVEGLPWKRTEHKTPEKEYWFHTFDLTNPQSPLAINTKKPIPLTYSFDIDPIREILFLFHASDNALYVYDLHGDDTKPLGGEPYQNKIDLRAWYPQTNQGTQFVFQARNLTVDPYRARIYAARPQWELSELLVISYPGVLPPIDRAYDEFASLHDFLPLEDPFDVSLPPETRPDLRDAFRAVFEPNGQNLFFVANVPFHKPVPPPTMVIPMRAETLTLAPACSAYKDFGCWYHAFSNGVPFENSPLYTDGAACLDEQHRVFVGTSYDVNHETNPGMLHLYRYDTNLTMTPFLTEGGGNLQTAGMPIEVLCH